RLRVGRTVNVDVAAHRVDVAETVASDLGAGQPQDTRQHEISVRLRGGKLGRPDLAGRTPCTEHRAERCAGADLRAHDVPASRRAVTAALLARAVFGRRHAIDAHGAVVLEERQALRRQIDLDPHAHASRSAASHALYGRATRFTL